MATSRHSASDFHADEIGRPGLAPGRYFRLLLIGYFEGWDAERAIAWRPADSFALRECLGLELPEAPPDHSTIFEDPPPDRSRNGRSRLHVDPAAARPTRAWSKGRRSILTRRRWKRPIAIGPEGNHRIEGRDAARRNEPRDERR